MFYERFLQVFFGGFDRQFLNSARSRLMRLGLVRASQPRPAQKI